MPIYNPRISEVDLEETRRYAGLSTSRKTFPESLLIEACARAKLFIMPRTTWEMYSYDAAFHTIMAQEPLLLTSESIISLLEGAVMVAVLAATVGERLEEEVSAEFTNGSYIKGLLLDAAGTSAVEQACDKTNAFITQRAAQFGCVTGKRFSPGYGDFELDVQPDILRLANAREIGLGVTVSMMLIPRKSVTAVIGVYPYSPTLKVPVIEKNNCDFCDQPQCDARKESKQK